MSQGADIAFPHLGITIGHLPKGITIGGFTIAFYGIIIACGMLAGLMLARWQAKRTGQAPDVFIVDEPTNNIDILSMEILTETLKDYQGTLLVVSHDNYFVQQIKADKQIELF